MKNAIRKYLRCGACFLAAVSVASAALLPVSAATADALGARGGGSSCQEGCHVQSSNCGGGPACSTIPVSLCVTSPADQNTNSCSGDSRACSDASCTGAETLCSTNAFHQP